MEQSKNYDPFQYNATENKNDGLSTSNQRFLQDPSSSINANIRPPDFTQMGGSKPVHYSIQTGEEFDLEFIRERVVPRKPFIPSVASDPRSTTTYMDLKGILGISHTGSDSGSDVSMLSTVEKGRVKDFDKKGSYVNENRTHYDSVRSVPRSMSRNSSTQGVPYGFSSGNSDSSSGKIKFLCSFGGKILPRPSDGRLRYVGGETRIIGINKSITWMEFMQKTMLLYNQAHTIKYQLPGEDLDALVSVSCDEDLQNMLEECTVLEDGNRSQKPRMFLVSSSESDDPHFGLGSMDGDSEIQYVVAVNGMDAGQRMNSIGQIVSTSANDLDQLLSLNMESETNRAARESAGTNAFPFASIPAPPTSTKYVPPEALLSATSAPVKGVSFFERESSGKQQEPVQDPLHPDAISAGQRHKSNDDDHANIFGEAHNLGYTGSEADSTDFGYEPPMVPQSVFHSERVPQKQGESELQNRLSKSDDSFGSQFLKSHLRSGLSQQEPITESLDKLNEVTVTSQMESSISSEKPVHANELRSETKCSELNASGMIMMDEKNPANIEGVREESGPQDIFSNDGGLARTERKEVFSDQAKTAVIDSGMGEGISNKQGEDPAASLPELHWGEIASNAANSSGLMEHADNSAQVGISTRDFSEAETSTAKQSTQGHGDILIDINDRFPRDFLSDIFSKERMTEDSSIISPLYSDGTGVSLNMENHDPKHWSFFQKLAQNEFHRRDVSLMDQDHLGYVSSLATVEEVDRGAYNFSSVETGINALGPADPRTRFEEEIQQETPDSVGPDIIDQLPYNPSHVQSESVQFDGLSYTKTVENPGIAESEYEEEKQKNGDFRGPLVDSAFGEIDISTLQIIKNEDLEELKELGSGTFGTVYHGKWRGTDVAIKRIKKSCFTGRSSEQERLTVEFWREADILSKLHHPNVVAFYGVVQDGPGATLATVAEFMVNGSLRHVLLRKDRYLDRRKRLIIAMDAAFGMEYLHSKNIVHFDLKCDNLLVNLKDPQRPICKVGDFGLSKIKRNTLVTGGVRGTLPWMAPELLNGSSSKVSEKVDVFSFGIVLWEILTGEEPYANMHYGAIIGGIVSNTLRPPVPSFCDAEWKRLMEQCWAPDPVVRPSFTEIASRLRVMSSKAPIQANK
ncbi:hypothetical protein AQUCO_01700764v1 [Aquilegia coerulea]|uniref:Protein kinase domain-containing protein n=1 Tax=Aquilegia coerulea TaxID=218851 RepID=A0A2G5DQC3_AQUCA|nr:hypothetical protein AQUCO_01700764v1 [Aquilegia coerulea]PIA45458.1 hypothetical protein AQUCO_01700764v1 [Aquilegia coerulea]PIA45459.1 hypothetical protein AQUCO_01700764v1 [Aquilegia coerulea]